MNRKTEEVPAQPKTKPSGHRPEADLTSQAWEATSPAQHAEVASLSGMNWRPNKRSSPGKKFAIILSHSRPRRPRSRVDGILTQPCARTAIFRVGWTKKTTAKE